MQIGPTPPASSVENVENLSAITHEKLSSLIERALAGSRNEIRIVINFGEIEIISLDNHHPFPVVIPEARVASLISFEHVKSNWMPEVSAYENMR
jgi:hypothetical protein